MYITALWPPVAVVLAHSIVAEFTDHRKWDPLFHTFGGAALGFTFLKILEVKLPQLSRVYRALFSFGLSCGAIVGWEIFEFVMDKLRGTRVQQSVDETMIDMILGMAGALACLAIAMLLKRSGDVKV